MNKQVAISKFKRWTKKLILLIIFLPSISEAQKLDYNWVFRVKAGVDFNNLVSPFIFVSKSNSFQSAASISDKEGDLLFYATVTNGLTLVPEIDYGTLIYGKNHSLIAGGDSINGIYNITNGVIIIPGVESENKYYVFCLGPFDLDSLGLQHLYYSVVEEINDSLVVTQKNIPVIQTHIEESLAAVKHANGKDWWILVHQYGSGWPVPPCSNRFYKVLLTTDGPQYMGEQDIGTLHCHFYSLEGELIFSRNGTLLAMVIPGQGIVDLFDFNRCSGNLSNHRVIDVIDVLKEPYSCEFSSQSNLLYISGAADYDQSVSIGGLYQYDLSAPDISGSKVVLWENSSDIIAPGQLQIAPNNKIYMAVQTPDTSSLGSYISVINSPDSLGLASDFRLYGLYLGDSPVLLSASPTCPTIIWGQVAFIPSKQAYQIP